MSPLVAYNALIVPAAIAAAPVAGVLALFRPSWRRGLGERLGIGWPRGSGSTLWAHAASVGEVEGIAPLVRRWSEENPGATIVVSALTPTGCDAARRLIPEACVRTFPLDLPWVARRVVRRVRPKLFLFSENEMWPNAIAELDRSGATIVQVSGRLSQRTARLLGRFPKLCATVLGRVALFCVQEGEHRDRLVELGAPGARIVVSGSLKGGERRPAIPEFASALGRLARPVVVAGSTHDGEEAMVLDALAHRVLRARPPILVLAPRHPERFAEVACLLERRQARFARRSALGDDPQRALAGKDVLLLDTLGELAGCYAVANAAFVGGTLVPVGGHNLLEPARFGVGIVIGPHHETVARVAGRLVAREAARVVSDVDGLASALDGFLDPARAKIAAAGARAVAAGEADGLVSTWNAIAALDSAVSGGARPPAGEPPIVGAAGAGVA